MSNRLKFLSALVLGCAPALAGAEPSLRPPAVPLVTNDPYLSIWSEADHLNDDVTRHWTHRPHSLVSLIRIDGKPFRLMGNEPKDVPAFAQTSVWVLPTQSVYEFEDGGVHVTMRFLSPALPHDLEAMSRPLSYITWEVRSIDGAEHAVSIYDGTSSELAVNSNDQVVECSHETDGPLSVQRVGTQAQPVLSRSGDDTRIDWGYAYVAADRATSHWASGPASALEDQFASDVPAKAQPQSPRPVTDGEPALAFTFDLGKVGQQAVSRHVIVAYDEVYSIKYFGHKLRPYWRRDGATPAEMLQGAEKDYPELVKRCDQFDKELMADLTTAGGPKYAQIAALAYRQSLAACGLAADDHGQPLLFTKENTSNGDIATVDVIFPMEPVLLLLSPTLTKASLVSVLDYSASKHWKFPNAPHDLGTYPHVTGRDDGGEGMPVEESGNMLILLDALAQSEGNADFAGRYWPQLTSWAKYLERYGLDPEDQLCTDDFMGHLAHNSNLSIKAILGLAAYGDLCRMRGDAETARKYRDLARADADHWVKAAAEGDHFRLAFDQPGTWSQKYNLVWDKLLKLNVFPPAVAEQEVAFYKSHLNSYGVPLDSRTKLTKTDWSLWIATLAEKPDDFTAFIDPIYEYLNTTTARSPLVDSYVTNDIHSDGMHARPVVGGLFIKALANPEIWKKWASTDKQLVGNWAPLPVPPTLVDVIPTGQHQRVIWKYTTAKPAADWTKPDFDDSQWETGSAPFGSRGTPGIAPRTEWKSDDIWLRRAITVPQNVSATLSWVVYHDEDIEIYVDGVLGGEEGNFDNQYKQLEIQPLAKALLKPGAKVVLAVHCHQTEGGQGVDVGLANEVRSPVENGAANGR